MQFNFATIYALGEKNLKEIHPQNLTVVSSNHI